MNVTTLDIYLAAIKNVFRHLNVLETLISSQNKWEWVGKFQTVTVSVKTSKIYWSFLLFKCLLRSQRLLRRKCQNLGMYRFPQKHGNRLTSTSFLSVASSSNFCHNFTHARLEFQTLESKKFQFRYFVNWEIVRRFSLQKKPFSMTKKIF